LREVANDLEAAQHGGAGSTDDLTRHDTCGHRSQFGFPDIAHRSIDEISVDDLKDEITCPDQVRTPA
jgi:hypothetical protein